jgi:hypothetical protein
MSYRKTVVSARRDQKKGRTGGLTEEQKQVNISCLKQRSTAGHATQVKHRATIPEPQSSQLTWLPLSANRMASSYSPGGFKERPKALGTKKVSNAASSLLTASFHLQEIREAFDLFDTDGSGTIDAKVGGLAARRAFELTWL